MTGRLVLAAAATALTLLLGEAAIRVFDLGPTFQVVSIGNYRLSENERLQYELLPGSPDGAHRISAAGLRDRAFALEKPAGTLRIAAIGDSLTFGSGVPREATWPKALERLLARFGSVDRPVEVLNFGVVGYDVSQVAEQLAARALPFAPDLAVYGYALNDPQAWSVERAALEDLRRASDASRRRGVLGPWMAHSRLFLLARHFLRGQGERARIPQRLDPAYEALPASPRGEYFRALHADAEGRARLEAGVAALADLQERGVPILVAIFPMFFDAPPSPYPLGDVHALVAGIFEAHGIASLDLEPAYRAVQTGLRQQLRVDFLHPNALGHRVAAAAVLHALDATALLPAGVPDRARWLAAPGLEGRMARLTEPTAP